MKRLLQEQALHDIEGIVTGLFIYPTDTIYGIGCDATRPDAVARIRELKQRDEKPFSIIAPSKEWILKHFHTTREELDNYLPGPYTLLLKKKDATAFSEVSSNEYVGVRIPDHAFTKALQRTGRPIVTTSVNLSGEPPARSPEDVPARLQEAVDHIIDAGRLDGRPSTIVKDGTELRR